MNFVFTLLDLLTRASLRTPNKTALIEGKKSLTYQDLEKKSAQLGNWLNQNGIDNGDRVGILLDKSIDCVTAMFGIAKAGGVFVNINTRLTTTQVSYQIENAGIKLIISSTKKYALINNNQTLPILDVKDFEGLEFCQPLGGEKNIIAGDLATILYTSGSTGMPKGVALSHDNLILGAKIVSTYLKNTKDDILISVLPFNFDYGLNQLTTTILVGGTLILQKSMFPQSICDTLIREKVTGFAGVPTIWAQLLQPLSDFSEREFPHLRYITNSGGSFPLQFLNKIQNILKNTDIYLMYGLTEAFRSTYLPPDEVSRRPTSMGKPIPGVEIAVVNEDSERCKPGEKGELVHRGGVICQGYWDNLEATDKVLRPWPFKQKGIVVEEMAVWSGDIVTQCEEGYLYFVGRNDEMIKSAGNRISPQEIEETLYTLGSLQEAVVFGVKDDILTQKIIAVVSLKKSIPDSSEQIIQYCRKELPDFMVPHEVKILASLPKTPNGKLDRSGIKAQLTAEFV